MKRKLLVLVTSAAVVAALAACSTSAAPASTSSAGEKSTITYGIWDDSFRPGYEQILAEFNKIHPEITVNFQVTDYDHYFTKLQTQISSQNEPDVYWLQNNSFGLYQKNGVLASLSAGIAANNVDLSGYPENTLSQFTENGELYALPWSAITVGLWYNKKLFDAAGVAYPTASWTWADMQSAAQKLTNIPAGQYGIVAPISGQEGFYNTIYQAGGSIIADNASAIADPAAVAGLSYWSKFVTDGYSPTVQQMSDTAPDALFQSGKVAMFFGGSYHSGTFAKNAAIAGDIDVTSLPAGKTKTTTLATAVNVVAKDSKNSGAAMLWADYLASVDAQKIQAGTGIVAPANTNAKDAWVKAIPAFNVGVFIDQVATAEPLPTTLNTPAWEAYFTPALTPLFQGQQSAQDAATALSTQIDAEIATEQQ